MRDRAFRPEDYQHRRIHFVYVYEDGVAKLRNEPLVTLDPTEEAEHLERIIEAMRDGGHTGPAEVIKYGTGATVWEGFVK